MNEIKKIGNQNAPIRKMWKEQFDFMDIHLNAEPPVEILKSRRPKESEDKYILEYRLNNFRHTAKSLFDRALDNVIEILYKSNIDYKSNSEILTQFISNYKKYSGGEYVQFKEWLFNDVVRYSEIDANALIVLLPKSDKELIPRFDAEIPVFKQSERIKGLDIQVVTSRNIEYLDENAFIFNAGDWVYKIDDKGIENKEKYYFIYNKNTLSIYYPSLNDSKIVYVEYPYYQHNLGMIPIQVLGNKYILKCDEAKPTKFKVYISNFYSAGLISDLYYGEISDTQLIGTKYHPIRYQVKTDCTANCIPNEHGVYCQGENTCQTCKGKGHIIDYAISDVFLMDKTDEFNKGTADLRSPIGYVTPPSDVLRLRHDIDDKYFDRIKEELCLNLGENNTNASANSKQIDKQYKVTFYSNIVESKLRWFENILKLAERLLEYKQETTVSIIKPRKWDVQTKEDLLTEISNLKAIKAPYFQILELVEQALKDTYGYSERAKKIIDYIVLKDKLIVYGDDLQTAKAIFGAQISEKDIIIHYYIKQILDTILNENPEIDLSNFDKLDEFFEKDLSKYITASQPQL